MLLNPFLVQTLFAIAGLYLSDLKTALDSETLQGPWKKGID